MDAYPACSALYCDPKLRPLRSPLDESLIQGCLTACSRTISAVRSVEPSSTMTHNDGSTVCDATRSITSAINSASSLAAVSNT
jgi:hypothetical protein